MGMPVYNGENFIRGTLDSLLAQTFEDFELIISDNGSLDKTQKICEEYADLDKRIRYYRNPENRGAAWNYNRVFELSKGEYFKWAAHDDVIAPEYLGRCVEILDRYPSVVLCFPGINYIDESGTVLNTQRENLSIYSESPKKRLRDLVCHQLRSDDIFWAIFGLVRKKALEKTSLIQNFVASDQVLLLEILLLGDFHQVSENLFYRRNHPSTSTRKYTSPKKRMKWFDPDKNSRIVLPAWNLLFKHMLSIKRAKLDMRESLCCYFEILRRFANRWRTLGGELKMVALEVIGNKTIE